MNLHSYNIYNARGLRSFLQSMRNGTQSMRSFSQSMRIIGAVLATVFTLATTATLTSCNESPDDNIVPEPAVVRTLDLTVTGSSVQAPYGNVYLFHSPSTSSGQTDVDLDYALGYGDGTTAPLIDVSQPYDPVVRYVKDGIPHTLHPVSAYGTRDDGALDNFSSVRYSQIHFDIDRLSTDYGRVQKGSVVLVVIVLNDPQSHSWVARTVQLRRDYLIHISLPDHKDPTYIQSGDLNAKWWQVDGEE